MITLKLTLRPPSTILNDVFRHDEMKCFVCNANGGQFSFPKEEDKLQKWITSLDIDRPKIVGANGPRICLKHFDQNDFTQKNRTRLASCAVPKPVISHDCKSFSNVRMGTETKIIGKDGSSTMVDLSVLAAMSNFSPLFKSILKDSPSSSLESIHIPDVPTTVLDSVLNLFRKGETITTSDSEVLKTLEFLNINISITSYRIPTVQKQKPKSAIVSSCQNNNSHHRSEDSYDTVINSTIKPKPLSLYRCPHCPEKSFKMKSVALLHFTDVHLRKQILSKIKIVRGQSHFQCPIMNCQYSTKQKAVLARHLGVTHGETEKFLKENHPNFSVKMSTVAVMEQSTPNVISEQPSNLNSSFWRSALIDQNIENSTPIPDEESNKIVTEGEGCNKDSTTKSRTLPSNTEVVGIKKIQNTHIMSQENATPPLERDELLEAIKSSGLPLRMRRTTLSIGNCWWIAVADQV